mmetsp:Transcript_86864/g.106545  ORF Transcript_86864/g.106545 Transcript_86864/m.106545 type:complete len:188 (+) Transcript_86864:744-1307(+)
MADDTTRYKIVVLGAGAVGKSSLTVRYINDHFLEDYDPTIEDYYRKLVDIDGRPALMDILDTAGQEEFASMQDEFFRQGKGFLLVYSITSQDTFDHVKQLRQKILRAKDDDNIPIVLCGNKCDLTDKRTVTPKQGEELAKQWNCNFYETSAKEKINNVVCFEQVVRAIREHSGENNKKKKGNRCIIL